MDIVLINLENNKLRLQRFQYQSARERFKFERVEAINGRKLNRKDLWIEKYDNRRSLSAGEIGCYLSHHNIYKSSENWTLVFEDDATLCHGFFQKMLGIISRTPSDWDIIMLGTTDNWKNKYKGKILWENDYVERLEGDIYGTQCYLITRKAKRLLIDNQFPINCPIDVKLNNMGLKVYVAKNEICKQGKLGSTTQ
tara:strand:+ start:317 stop:904 length:588 start_codon:yes stop_codon:yes gene_type:complete